MKCRHCAENLKHTFLDLGFSPPSNAYLSPTDLNRPEIYLPLKVHVCDQCWLVQTEDYSSAESLFQADYAYFSSTSHSWLRHAKDYSDRVISEFKLTKESFVIEIASNDGYLLRNFVSAGIPCLGIEPTASTADEAEKKNIPVVRKFFNEAVGQELAKKAKKADLIIGNNVYAHVPEINDFTKGLKAILKLGGTITLEFPHLMRLIENTQFDTIYHEHFSYLSLYTVNRMFSSAGLRIWRVEELLTHGGSLRVYGCHANDSRETHESVRALLQEESENGLQDLQTFLAFQARVDKIKNELLLFLIKQKKLGKTIGAYGAAAKGNTLLNYAGVKPDLLPFVCDAAISKQGKFMPGSHIPILAPSYLTQANPDFVLILPWNIAEEVKSQNSELVQNGSKFVTAVPEMLIS